MGETGAREGGNEETGMDGQNHHHHQMDERTSGTTGGGGGRDMLHVGFAPDEKDKTIPPSEELYRDLKLRKARPNEHLTHWVAKLDGKFHHVKSNKRKLIDAQMVRGKIVESGGNPDDVKFGEDEGKNIVLEGEKTFGRSNDGKKFASSKKNKIFRKGDEGKPIMEEMKNWTVGNAADGKMVTNHETVLFDYDEDGNEIGQKKNSARIVSGTKGKGGGGGGETIMMEGRQNDPPPKDEAAGPSRTSGGQEGGGEGEEEAGRDDLKINFNGDAEAAEHYRANEEEVNALLYRELSLRKARPGEQLTHHVQKVMGKNEYKHIGTRKVKNIDASGVKEKVGRNVGNPDDVEFRGDRQNLEESKTINTGSNVVMKANAIFDNFGPGNRPVVKEWKWTKKGDDGKKVPIKWETQVFDYGKRQTTQYVTLYDENGNEKTRPQPTVVHWPPRASNKQG